MTETIRELAKMMGEAGPGQRAIVAGALAGPALGHAGMWAVRAADAPALIGLIMLNLMVGPTFLCLGMAAALLIREAAPGSLGARVNPFWLACAGVDAGIVLTVPPVAVVMMVRGDEIPGIFIISTLASPVMAAVMPATARRTPREPGAAD